MMIPRAALARLKALAAQFPAVLLLGPRQCGKTTLARHFIEARYFDLEKPSDLQVFSSDIEYALGRLRGPLILDEAQTLPALFPVLRAVIDDKRKAAGQYFLLGSVSPELLRNISESLAGRVGVLELTPFLYSEIAGRRGSGLEALWLRGGFPNALLARTPDDWSAWHENYMRTFIERDVPRHRLKLSAIEMRRLMTMIAHSHGGLLNASNLGRSLGYSYHTIHAALDLLEGYYLIRRLVPFHANVASRLVKAPKLYTRDSGILHYLLGISTPDQLLASPARGNSFEGFMIEQIVAREKLRNPGSAFYYFRKQTGVEIDLVVDRGRNRIGYEFKAGVSTEPRDWAHLRAGIEEGVIHEGIVVYGGSTTFEATRKISVVAAEEILTQAQ